jgi:hypothetical protein
MSTTKPQPAPLRSDGDGDGHEPHVFVPAPRRPADDAPDRAPSAEEWVTYPGVRYALERITAQRSGTHDDPASGNPA